MFLFHLERKAQKWGQAIMQVNQFNAFLCPVWTKPVTVHNIHSEDSDVLFLASVMQGD